MYYFNQNHLISNDFFSNMNQFHLLRLLSSHSTQKEHCILTYIIIIIILTGQRS